MNLDNFVDIIVPDEIYTGLYKINENGDIYSVRSNRLLTKSYDKDGYAYVRFNNGAFKKAFRVHRLVALTFIDNPNSYNVINHIDGNKENNHYTNLEWCTSSHNNRHAFSIGARSQTGSKNSSAKLTEDDVIMIRQLFSENRSKKSLSEEYSVSMQTISDIINRKTWIHI